MVGEAEVVVEIPSLGGMLGIELLLVLLLLLPPPRFALDLPFSSSPSP